MTHPNHMTYPKAASAELKSPHLSTHKDWEGAMVMTPRTTGTTTDT